MTPESVPCDATVSCEVTVTVTPECPVVDERDCYNVTVAWTPNGETLEKHALKAYLREFNDTKLTQETVVAQIYGDLQEHSVRNLAVRAHDTEHLEMVVTKP